MNLSKCKFHSILQQLNASSWHNCSIIFVCRKFKNFILTNCLRMLWFRFGALMSLLFNMEFKIWWFILTDIYFTANELYLNISQCSCPHVEILQSSFNDIFNSVTWIMIKRSLGPKNNINPSSWWGITNRFTSRRFRGQGPLSGTINSCDFRKKVLWIFTIYFGGFQ